MLREVHRGQHPHLCTLPPTNQQPTNQLHPHLTQVCVSHPESKGKYIKIILALLQSSSTAVVYECAGTLVALSQAPTAIRAAANCYCQLLVSQSDNNVKLIVLVGFFWGGGACGFYGDGRWGVGARVWCV